MPSSLALLLWVILLAVLLRVDPANRVRTSPALWVPMIWMFIVGSRLPAQWIDTTIGKVSGDALEDGNPLDRLVFTLLILVAHGVLVSRSFNWTTFLSKNMILAGFLIFAALSATWSDYPAVALKRWFRDLGNVLIILVPLTDRDPVAAVSMLLRRLGFIMISLSVVLIKYFSGVGRGYSPWTGEVTYVGVTTSKYMLAVICLVFGLYFFWDIVRNWPTRTKPKTRLTIFVDVIFMAMTLWVMHLSDGKTCQVCLVIGCLVIVAAHSKVIKRYPGLLKSAVLTGVCLCLFLVFGIDMKANLAEALGRDPTLTDRTYLWAYLMTMNTNPILGAGYESFWLGPRLIDLWTEFAFRPNQAHNGFLEVYLNLGIAGVVLVTAFLVATYRGICKRPWDSPDSLHDLSLALWCVLPICSITTACYFKGDLLWLTFLLTAVSLPRRFKKKYLDSKDRIRKMSTDESSMWGDATEPARNREQLDFEASRGRGHRRELFGD